MSVLTRRLPVDYFVCVDKNIEERESEAMFLSYFGNRRLSIISLRKIVCTCVTNARSGR